MCHIGRVTSEVGEHQLSMQRFYLHDFERELLQWPFAGHPATIE